MKRSGEASSLDDLQQLGMDREDASRGTEVYHLGDEYYAADDTHQDRCFYCHLTGELLCCDTCDRAFHMGCLVPPIRRSDLPDGPWNCPVCITNGTAQTVDRPTVPPPLDVPSAQQAGTLL